MCTRWMLLCLFVLGTVHYTTAALASTWDYCNCRFDTWTAWSDCTSSCFGQRQRSRSVWLTQYAGCDEFTDCATPDEGRDYQGCNENCLNGGTNRGSYCSCVTGYTGTCCSNRITCGAPDNIENGNVVYPHTYYGATAAYTCNQHYNLTDGSDVRTCQTTRAWSGQKPRCAYVNHCARDQPCQNGATCTDLLDDYTCTCQPGWSGQHCDQDVQPPVMTGCLGNQNVNATDTLVHFDWTEPNFTDPFGNDVQVVANYPNPEFNFPWGDFTVQYVATKPSNGLQTECNFEVRVRPTPCEELNVPRNSTRMCNGWRADYGRFCIVACQSTYTIDPSSHNYQTMYVCGASGQWTASAPLPDCDIFMSDTDDIIAVQPAYDTYSYTSSCNDGTTRTQLQNLYIDTLTDNASFGDFCADQNDCLSENVLVDC